MKADMIPAMLEPEFLTVCKKFKRRLGGAPIVFVIEDADKVVASRMNDNVSALSDLLNLTDGLAGTALDIRVIATTNANVEEFDHAVLRPGRLAARIELGPLDAERANIIFERLGSSKRTDVPMTLAEVYASSRGTKNVFVKQAKRKMAGFLR
jgi:ATP-dependent 26S proteasome regulatory subunit